MVQSLLQRSRQPSFSPFTESEAFENPTAFRLDNFADDNNTRHLYSLMIRPGFLPVGISTSNRIIKPGYETCQPVIAARQFGLGQVPPHFHIHHLVESRADLPIYQLKMLQHVWQSPHSNTSRFVFHLLINRLWYLVEHGKLMSSEKL